MLIKKTADIRPSEITSKANYLNRRTFIRAGSIAGASILAGPAMAAVVPDESRAKLPGVGDSEFSPLPSGYKRYYPEYHLHVQALQDHHRALRPYSQYDNSS